MAAMRPEQVQRFILAKKIFWGYGHFNDRSAAEGKGGAQLYLRLFHYGS